MTPSRSSTSRHLLLLGLCLCPAVAFSATVAGGRTAAIGPLSKSNRNSRLAAAVSAASESPLFSSRSAFLRLRGGQQGGSEDTLADGEGSEDTKTVGFSAGVMAPVASVLQSFGSTYSSYLTTNPILTKSVTASTIFGLSDYAAQRIENSSKDEADQKMNWTRTITSMLVGLLYFGPAAHAWYETIFKVLPGTSLISTLQKAALGQLLFGPSFTCVFFATSLMQSGTFSLGNWFAKIKSDLPGAWAAGLGFWPFVDLVSYSLIPPQFIPLFVNFCSFVWTIYLSMVANRGSSDDKQAD